MIFVLIGWVMFRADTVTHAFGMYGGMIGLNGWAMTAEMAILARPTEMICLVIGVVLSLYPAWSNRMAQPKIATFWTASAGARTLALFALCTVIIQARGEAPFLYFQF